MSTTATSTSTPSSSTTTSTSTTNSNQSVTLTTSNVSVSPATFSRFVGGMATISVTITPSSGVSSVAARLQSLSRRLGDTPLLLIGNDVFTGTATIPANVRVDGQSEIYTVSLVITDTAGNQRIDFAGTTQVPSALGDPGTSGGVPPPPSGIP